MMLKTINYKITGVLFSISKCIGPPDL